MLTNQTVCSTLLKYVANIHNLYIIVLIFLFVCLCWQNLLMTLIMEVFFKFYVAMGF